MERTKRKSSVYNDCVPYGGRVPNFKEKEGDGKDKKLYCLYQQNLAKKKNYFY